MTGLVQLLSDWRGAIPDSGAWIEEKKDGWRAFFIPDWRGTAHLWTRNGHPIEGVGHIMHQLARMEREAGEKMFFDGELVVDGSLAATKHWCETGYKLGGEAGVFHVFDAMPLNQWKAGGGATPLYQRKATLKALVEATTEPEWEWRPGSRGRDDDAPAAVQLVADDWAFDAREVVEKAREIWAAGGEGLVIKDAEAPYQRKRCNAWQKVKIENFGKWKDRI